MPAWWPTKKSPKIKESDHSQLQQSSHVNYNNHHRTNLTNKPTDDIKERAKSFEDVILSRNSPAARGFLRFDSADSIEKKGHPLPRPSVSDPCGVASASSISSVSSNGSSSDDHIIIASDQPLRGSGEMRLNVRPKSPCSRGATCPTSPLHPRLSGMSLESPTGSLGDGKSQSQCHRLPLPPGSPSYPLGSHSFPPGSPTMLPASLPGTPMLPPGSPTFPPGSPTSPSTLHNSRIVGVTENAMVTSSKVKKGRLLGRGTFGHVYLGFNSENGQMCAIKEVKVFSDDQSCRERMKQLNQEINLLSQLSHPNIVRYYGSELNEESLSVFLEYVSGGSIHKLLQEYGPFGEPVIQTYTRQILSGLAYLHGRNTVHRDIKGANILVDPNGEIKLADFGMAKHITAATSMLSFKGSPYWMAPEVVMNTNGYSLAVDIWSLGCTVLEMATAKPPWSQYEGVAAIFKIGNSKDIPEIPSHLSGDVKSFVKLCLQREPSARPTASELLNHPFVRDQATTRVSNNNVMRDTFPYGFDGTRTPPVLELHSQRHAMSSSDFDYVTRSPVAVSRTPRSLSPRDNPRTITSLPVSPTSSPLRQYGTAHRSCFLSPPHPAYALVGQTNYNLSDFSSASRPNSRSTHDPISILLRSQTPGGRTL